MQLVLERFEAGHGLHRDRREQPERRRENEPECRTAESKQSRVTKLVHSMSPLNRREGGALSRHRGAQEVLIRTQVGPPATGTFVTTVLTASRATGVIYSPLSPSNVANSSAGVKTWRVSRSRRDPRARPGSPRARRATSSLRAPPAA